MPASTVMPDVVVEIAFATGPNDPSPTWVDVSSYVEAQTVISITRGRSDELEQAQPSTCSVTLDNRDGRFTPGNTSSPYYPNVKKGRRLRVSATWPLSGSPVTYRRFSGYVDQWPMQWPDGTSATSTVTVTASSRLARLGRGVELRSIIEEEYLLDGPVAYYPLGEPEGSTVAGNVATTNQPSLAVAGTGTAPVFGTATGPGTDDMTACSFAGGKYLTAALPTPLARERLALECFFSTTDTSAPPRVMVAAGAAGSTDWARTALEVADGGLLYGSSRDGFGNLLYSILTSPSPVADGATHHALLRETVSGGTVTGTLFLDGVQVATGAGAAGSLATYTQFSVGGDEDPDDLTFNGVLAHAAVISSATAAEITATRVDAHYDSGATGFSGEPSDARIDRLAGYAGVPTSEVSTETGLTTSMSNQFTGGKTALTLMQEVATTEGGLLFDARDGTLTFHARNHRYNAASVLTLSAAAGEIEASLEPRLDDLGLVNDMTASRSGGASVRAVDQASIDDYGLYRDSVELLTTADSEVLDAANWKVYIASTPQVRVPSAEVDVLNSTSAQKTALLVREIGDRITLSGLPSQAPASSMDFFIEGYTETIGAESYVMAFNLSPASLSGVWQLDSVTYSVLGTTTRLGY